MQPAAATAADGVLARSQRAIVNVYTIIALLYCAASTWLYYEVAAVPALALVHLVSFAVISVNYVVLQRTGNYTWATHCILAVGTLVVSSQFALGGWGHTGYLWTFAYLPYAFFLATPAIARLWVTVLVVVDGLLVGLDAVGAFALAYQGLELIIFTASLAVFLLCMFLFQAAVLRSEGVADARSRDLAQANARLTASEAGLALAQELAHVGSWVWEPGRPISVSTEMRRIFALASEPEAKDLDDLLGFIHAEDRAAVQTATQATLADGRPLEFEARLMRQDGTMRLGSWRARAERDAAGRVVRLIGTTQDVTEVREAEEARRRAAAQVQDIENLREVNRLRTQFMNTAAHELSTPLTPIQVELRLLSQPDVDADPQRRSKALAVIGRNVQRLTLLVQDLLDGARLQSSNLTLHRAKMDLSAAVNDAVHALEGVAAQAHVTLVANTPAGMWIDGDARRLAQVLDNLIANALKFTPAGGRVVVGVQRASGGVAVRVVDTGIGLRSEAIPRLFQPFSQVHDTMQRTRAGSGLGLYIAKGIVEAHGGAIGVESGGPGKGSVFWFVLPSGEGPEAPPLG
ncbi:MAG: PAS domain-containing sensor histidine kinase [Candidatus Thermoplasmatota archaeon]|jgi:PAS domain S-box-containing protein